MPPMDRRPYTLAVSPRRLRPRRTLPSDLTPPSSAKTKTPAAARSSLPCGRFSRVERPVVSPGLIKMAMNANEGFEEEEEEEEIAADLSGFVAIKNSTGPLFERGRFYELYSARRNERLKRKQTEMVDENVELAKKRHAKKKAESVRKSVGRTSSLRSSVRSSKEMKKWGSAAVRSCQKPTTAGIAGNRIGTRRI